MIIARDALVPFAKVVFDNFKEDYFKDFDAADFINQLLLNEKLDWSAFSEFVEGNNVTAVEAIFFIKYFLHNIDIDIDLSELDLDPRLKEQFQYGRVYSPTITFDELELTEGEEEFPCASHLNIETEELEDVFDDEEELTPPNINWVVAVKFEGGDMEYVCEFGKCSNKVSAYNSDSFEVNGKLYGFTHDDNEQYFFNNIEEAKDAAAVIRSEFKGEINDIKIIAL